MGSARDVDHRLVDADHDNADRVGEGITHQRQGVRRQIFEANIREKLPEVGGELAHRIIPVRGCIIAEFAVADRRSYSSAGALAITNTTFSVLSL